jgi:restriction endonuclease Mrr
MVKTCLEVTVTGSGGIHGMLSVKPDTIEIIALSIKKLVQNHFD